MSDNKYGLDFNVMRIVSEVKKDVHEKIQFLEERFGEKYQKLQKEIAQERLRREQRQKEEWEKELQRQAQIPKEEIPIEFSFKDAQFLPDNTTDFNKPCKFRVELVPKTLGKIANKVVRYELWTVYNGKDHSLQVIGKFEPEKNIAETTIKLVTQDDYITDTLVKKKTDCSIEYYLKLSMYGAKPDKSKLLKMPIEKDTGEYYGGFVLKSSDNDATKTWGGQVRTGTGAFVKELQTDLVKIGHWISNPEDSKHKGMNANGSFTAILESAVKTFQFERYLIDAQGNIDKSKIDKITGIVDKDTAKLIKNTIKNMGDKKWDRPGHKPSTEWEESETAFKDTDEYKPNRTFAPDNSLFYQLPPSGGYFRRGSGTEYGSRILMTKEKTKMVQPDGTKKEVYIRFKPKQVIDNDDCDWLIVDCWGTKEQIVFLKNMGDTWLKAADGNPRKVKDSSGTETNVEVFAIGDVSYFNGGPMKAHNGHMDGNSTDLNCNEPNMIFSPNRFEKESDREQTLAFCKLLEGQVKNIYHNCHYIISNIDKCSQEPPHHHHLHFDGPKSEVKSRAKATKFTTCADCSFFEKCDHRIYKIRDNVNTDWKNAILYDPNYPYTGLLGKGKGIYKLTDQNSIPLTITKKDYTELYSK